MPLTCTTLEGVETPSKESAEFDKLWQIVDYKIITVYFYELIRTKISKKFLISFLKSTNT